MRCSDIFNYQDTHCVGIPIRYFVLYNPIVNHKGDRASCCYVTFCEKCSRYLTYDLKEGDKTDYDFYYREIEKEAYNIYKILE